LYYSIQYYIFHAKKEYSIEYRKGEAMPIRHDPHSIGGRICSVRLAHGLTQGHFATSVGVPRHAVTAYEQGGDVPLAVMLAIGDIFQVNWVWILTGIGPRDAH
jgi:DNA-binding XRE family transcriptional regulator